MKLCRYGANGAERPIIATGTPPGVGMGMKPEPQWLKPGDVVELGIEGLGRQTQHVRAYPE